LEAAKQSNFQPAARFLRVGDAREARLAAVEVQQASHVVVLGEVKALLTEVRGELRSKSRVS
jgi:hypothetical protein